MIFFYCLLCYWLGMIVHIAIKIAVLNKDTVAAATPAKVFTNFFNTDWPLLFLSFVVAFVYLVGVGFFLKITPEDSLIPGVLTSNQETFKKGLYVGSIAFGAMGDLIILGLFSKAKREIDKRFSPENAVPTKSEIKEDKQNTDAANI